jgi:hypothetical protein
MKHHLLFLLVLACVTTARAQSYSITSSVIASGGGTSSGTGVAGTFAITGAIAQPEAHAASTGGPYSLSGGFFSQYMALQKTGAPPLIIRTTGENVQLIWGANVPGWVLQSNATGVFPDGWFDVVGAPTVSGQEQFHTFGTSGGRVFFRLRKR